MAKGKDNDQSDFMLGGRGGEEETWDWSFLHMS